MTKRRKLISWRRSCRRLLLAVAVPAALLPPVSAAADDGWDVEASRPVIAELRRQLGVDPAIMDDSWSRITHLGRPAVLVNGWARTGWLGAEKIDRVIFDAWSRTVVEYRFFAGKSRRRRGEAILSMGSVSLKSDGYLALFETGVPVGLEGIQRYRTDGADAIYYELRYRPLNRDVAYLVPLVRLLVNASTGDLYRFELAVDYLFPAPPGSPLLTRSAAGRIAAVFLRRPEQLERIGWGVAFEETMEPELTFVRPNGWLRPLGEDSDARVRLAWVVPFAVRKGTARLERRLFLDAASGRVIGGEERPPEP